MITVAEIRQLKEYYVNTLHQNRIKQQLTDQTYIDDTFEVPFIKAEVSSVRTGKGFRMCSSPAEHIITANPQAFRISHKNTQGETDRAANVAKETNRWLDILKRQNPQPFKQFVKHLLGRGEAWIYFQHNNDFDPADPNGLPVLFSILDPLIVFGDHKEWNGIPERVMIYYDRTVSSILETYPTFKSRGMTEIQNTVPFFMYFDKDVRYYEANKEPLLREFNGDLANGDGLQENIYGFVSLVHAYSGFGMGSADGDPASLAVGRLRHCRDLIGEYTAINSTLNSIIFRYAHRSIDLFYPAGGSMPSGDVGKNYNRAPNAFNIIGLPEGASLKPSESMLPDAQLYQYMAKKEMDIDKEDPLASVAEAIGTSGRQQDIATMSSLRRYDTIVENCASAFSTAFGGALRIIEKLEHLCPSSLKSGDIGGNYDLQIELKAKNPIEQDRLRTLGSRLYQQGEIDLETNLIKYQGYTQEEARLIMARILADNATRNNPLIAAIMGEQAAREIGMEDQYRALREQGERKENTLSPVPQIGSEGGESREGNIKTETGEEMMDMSLAQRGARRSPTMLNQMMYEGMQRR